MPSGIAATNSHPLRPNRTNPQATSPSGAFPLTPRPIQTRLRPASSPHRPSSPLQLKVKPDPYVQPLPAGIGMMSPHSQVNGTLFIKPKVEPTLKRLHCEDEPPPKAQAVPLAPDAIRYDNSAYKRHLVAMYRYKDAKYKEILSAARQPPPIPLPPRRLLPPVTLVYDHEAGSAFFRQLPRLQERLDSVGLVKETLVPIRLDIEAGGMALSDAFTWNLNDNFISLETFAEGLCRDLHLPAQLFRDAIVESIRTQLLDYAQHGQEGEEAIENLERGQGDAVPTKLTQLAELRILIKLDITVGRVSLVDQFEWDILCPLNSPERFAAILSADLGLGGEFTTAIAHGIREQIYSFIKSLVILGYKFDGSPINDPNLASGFLAPVVQGLRDRHATEKFTPILVELSQVELVRQAKSKERETRRNRRQQRARRRPALLPDRDPIATCRTLPHPQLDFCPLPFPHGDPSALGGNLPTSPSRDVPATLEACHPLGAGSLRPNGAILQARCGTLPQVQSSAHPCCTNILHGSSSPSNPGN
ncbi:SWI/SNF chromatin-remodeling complex subunit [Massospora cicadina]|nr:SWI/SNF chromatin-remodeling complex subunit [Massospora cicadina]